MDAGKRFRSAFVLYLMAQEKQTGKHRMKKMGRSWKRLPEEERKKFEDLSRDERLRWQSNQDRQALLKLAEQMKGREFGETSSAIAASRDLAEQKTTSRCIIS